MVNFNEYLDIVRSNAQTTNNDFPRRSEWSSDEIAGGIVSKAIIGLFSLLCPDFEPPIHKISDDVFSITRSIIYRGCRIHILGSTNVKNTPLELISEAIDKSREAIVLCILASVGAEMLDFRKPVSVDMKTGVIPLYPNDIDALAIGKATVEKLIEYKLFRRILLERPDPETQFVDRLFSEYGCNNISKNPCFLTIDSAIDMRGENAENWIDHPYLQQIDSNISKKRHNLLLGYSSSGKTILAFQVAKRRICAGWQVQYINLSDNISTQAGIIQGLLFSEKYIETNKSIVNECDRLIIVDDLQSNPALARLFLALGSLLHRVRDNDHPIILGISWKEFAPEATMLCPEVVPTAIHAELIRSRLIEKYSAILGADTVRSIEKESGDDIYLLSLALDVTARQKNLAGRTTVAEDVWLHRLPSLDDEISLEKVRRSILLVAAIGQFDIHVPPMFVQRIADVTPKVISSLIESRFLRRIGDRVTLGHRSLCTLMVSWLGNNGAWNDLINVNGPHDVTQAVFSYLSTSGTAVMIDAIRAIVARTGFKTSSALGHRAEVIVNVWRAFDAVIERVENQQLVDPTWGNTPSSSMFVTVLLSEIGKIDMAQQSIDFLRAHWRIINNHIDIDPSGFSTCIDFDILRQRMIDEDSLSDCQVQYSALDVDIVHFHKTWLAGLILGSEAATNNPIVPLEQLASCMEREQIPASGSFYPERVPWCTARVVLGLVACGRSVETSHAVQRAVQWLMRDRKDGGASTGGVWHSGTGTWNSTVETTALVILALVKAGVDPSSSECIISGREFLLKERENWFGFEGAAAIEALLSSGSKWEDLADDAERVAQLALDQSLWLSATLPANEIFQQTCHVAQAATHLIEIGWKAIQSDLAELLAALDLPDGVVPMTSNFASEEVEKDVGGDISFNADISAFNGDEMAMKIQKIDSIDLKKYCIIGNYLRFDGRTRTSLHNYCKAILNGLNTKTLLRENYLIWAPPGSGKSFLVSEIAQSLGNDFVCNNFRVLNLSTLTKDQFISEVNELRKIANRSTLCMIDEIDSRATELWPYEELFSCLDWNINDDKHIVFVLAGSSGRGLNGMMRAMQERSKGSDLLDRIPDANRFEIPSQIREDRITVFVKQVLMAASARNQVIKSVDALALYYVLKHDALDTNRQIGECAKSAVARMDVNDECLLYDHMFRNGDNLRMKFYSRNVESSGLLQGKEIWINE